MSDFTLEELFNYRRHGAGKLVNAYEEAADLIEKQQARIVKLEGERAEVVRRAFVDGFMDSFEGFNSEIPKAVKYVRDRESIEYAERVKRGEV